MVEEIAWTFTLVAGATIAIWAIITIIELETLVDYANLAR